MDTTASRQPFLVDVLGRRQKIHLRVLITLWLLSVSAFWIWWLSPLHMGDMARFAINTVILAWNSLLPGFYFYFLNRMKKQNPDLKIPRHWRIAMVVTRAPSEPFELVKKTLISMKLQDLPHDTWLADEDPTLEIREWCAKHGICISTRKGNAEYYQQNWPRREKCKEGNLAYFYDHYGYRRYDFVSQLDADHVPSPGYLHEMILPFVDPKVGYVSAPSICDVNAQGSWAARGRLFAEATLHGTLQAGYTNGWAPLCIGSHYAVRTEALSEIGGLGPELAEDHSTTLMMNAFGWKGVHALNAEAHGDGPTTFMDSMTQEFQWARSLVMLLLTVTPGCWKRLTPKFRFQFIFSQLWYPIFGVLMLAAYMSPLVAVMTGVPWVHISYIQFLAYSFFPFTTALLVVAWVRRQHLMRPADVKILSWEGAIFQLVRWPWVLWATCDAIRTAVFKKKCVWRITPKGRVEEVAISLKAIWPYASIVCLSGLSVLLAVRNPEIKGYYWFAFINCFAYLACIGIIIVRHVFENKIAMNFRNVFLRWGKHLVMMLILMFLTGSAVYVHGEDAWSGITWNSGSILNCRNFSSICELGGTTTLVAEKNRIGFGAYDPSEVFQGKQLAIEHVFISWNSYGKGSIARDLAGIEGRGREPLLTIEPWLDPSVSSSTDVLSDVAAGIYDSKINDMCSEIAASEAPVFVRWGHEMETISNRSRYPWAVEDAPKYQRAYRHFVEQCRASAKNVLYVWSPAGDKGLERYWPGSEYVDSVGISIYGFPEWDLHYFKKVRSFAEIMKEKYARVEKYRKPIMIAELGVAGDKAHQLTWMLIALDELRGFPLVTNAVYFNSLDNPKAWGDGYSTPDWSMDPKAFPTTMPITAPMIAPAANSENQ
ncbi:MAG: glycosyl transferase [Candidatus Taylorbacteria bacterium]|nr:glycosyl transferase [Candidatus Taylorbacteria bacterium]